ncbi:imidazole glycerol phosphate synthase subunit HisH [Barnesiella sp. WM24]|uniref:imidazole glycerol phosphate synthase subunit HisH n=1 Tax=Barnesiella sp. WM24 TaxID=2558278 RepID=UPI00107252C1|nr:imidazole glycerol phosphate synthase subunit HisH [Barnesiella sp. WM24]TFU92916.1 imidazole glycerol phosphate synthase subunit HisH [Barnesiella sp. WM24]
MGVAIIKYNAGNNFSVLCSLRRLGVEATVTDDADKIRRAEKVIFPGVGEASSAMSYLRATGLDQLIKSLQQPVLGICIGQQLLCRHSMEGDTECLGVFDAEVRRFPDFEGMKIPHMGWNTVSSMSPNGVITPETDNSFVYYVHSYYVPVCDLTTAVTDYIVPFSAAMRKDNFYSTQFHPEKSGDTGEAIIKTFLEL